MENLSGIRRFLITIDLSAVGIFCQQRGRQMGGVHHQEAGFVALGEDDLL